MVDDWSGIEEAPSQLHGIVRLGSPEPGRYRPGFVVWNELQWYTLGAPASFLGPKVWEALRIAVVILGVTLLALLLAEAGYRRIEGRDPRWLLVAGVPLAAITAPSLVIDLARYAPQEILLVGSMGLGAALLVRCLDALLDRPQPGVVVGATAAAGLLFWWFGVLQKETSLCVLLLAPFLWPTIAGQRPRWDTLARRRRIAVGLLAGGILLPYLPLGFRTAQLWLAGVRPYPEATAAKSFVDRFSDQLSGAGFALGSDLPTIIAVAAFVVVASSVFGRGTDWLSIGLLVVALAFLVAAAGTGVVVSRYYFPAIVLAALALVRSVIPLGTAAVLVTGAVLVVGGAWQVRDSRGWTKDWVDEQRAQEASCVRPLRAPPGDARSA